MSFYSTQIDKNVPIPLYYQLKELIISEIKKGNYEENSMIPTEKEFSDIFSISRTTVRQAVTELVQEGWLYRIKSKGTFVTSPKVNQAFIQYLEPFNEQILRSGRTPSTHLLDFQVIKADEQTAEQLNISPGTKVFFLYRLRFADKDPIVLVKTFIPCDICPELSSHNFSRVSLYSVLGQKSSSRIHHVRRVAEAVAATEEDSRYLGLAVGEPIHFFTSIGYTAAQRPVEYSLARYRGDKNQFEVIVYPKNNKC
ncbi:MAG: GntR family transcriptional regulator [Lachnospiraceae bacterium]